MMNSAKVRVDFYDLNTDIDDEMEVNNPLIIEVVVKEIVKFLPKRELKVCRLVCRKWNEMIIPRFRTQFEIYLLNPRKYAVLSDFIELMESSDSMPFGKFSFHHVPMRHELVDKFFLLCGPLIQYLGFQLNSTEIDISNFREILFSRAPFLKSLDAGGEGLPEEVTNHCQLFSPDGDNRPTLPNLKTISFNADEGQKFNFNFLSDLFCAACNLEELEYRRNQHVACTMTVLSALEVGGNFRKLKKLTLGSVEESNLQLLIQFSKKGMKLREFFFEYLTKDVKSKSFEEFLFHQRNSLERLMLNECFHNEHITIRLPPMVNLKDLRRTAFSRGQILYGPICYATQFPNLEELVLYAFADELDWNEYFSETENKIPCTSLKRLEAPIKMKDPIHLLRLAKIFPCLKSLEINSPDNSVIPLIWKLWPEIETIEMYLSGNENIDSIFTGVSVEECNNIRETESFTEVDSKLIRTEPSLSDLKQLKKFSLETSATDSLGGSPCAETTSLLTDVTGYLELANMTQLNDLHISCSKISLECYQNIRRRFSPESSVRIYDINEEQYDL